ncbi:hypothetical protein GCM10010218_22900 [Streptomyces mashuensis]|uniref:Uncharacterized protein n=1 Tax=Streptomyces mashuensis TaxID=33904 RepID=A0A919B1A6_9ACTN|nr:hypothetical protein [Streptomyces mashuensis]GHF40903.1 hypothetical protein GCM10010218_22900 [Streptomyces mashuensis]
MPLTPEQSSEFAPGDLVWDTAACRAGEVMDHRWSRYQLRPLGGGTEWYARGEDLVSHAGPGPQCGECRHIRTSYHNARRAGDTEGAARWITEMGVHLRAAHA